MTDQACERLIELGSGGNVPSGIFQVFDRSSLLVCVSPEAEPESGIGKEEKPIYFVLLSYCGILEIRLSEN